ncbi:MAG: tRNA (N6-isopentenyl adenosine(37)-C2)-methylthiotransferase MiaB [Deltaproteobacteria bacterium]|nr:tRNA (N6-isopentenyl adenosine(37)-C2)-methylthiotransferase MiaB [Deltaproteobacteria bacterium]
MTDRIHIRTFGCQMNVHDSERMLRLMQDEGWVETSDPGAADLIVVNTCSVREKAYHKVRSAVGRFQPLKDGPRPPVIAVAGCVARQEGERWLEHCPHVDIVLGPDAVSRLPARVQQIRDGSPPIVDVEFDEGRPGDFLCLPGSRQAGPTAYLTVMKGCSHRCTFCIVPRVRGSMRHRPAQDILDEARQLVDGGVREVTLLGQTVNAWTSDGRDFAWLLGRLDGVEGLERIRYTSPHPIYLTDGLVRAHATLQSLCEHVHLPVQSGSDRVLKRMGRRHDRESYVSRVRALLDIPGFTLSTDLIVGFPGESEENFQATLDLVEQVGFDTFFSFKYSPRPGTPATRWPDDVPAEVKQERLERLHRLGQTLTQKRFSSDLGRRVEVLVEGPSRSGEGQLTGRTRTNRIVNFTAPGPDPCGRLVDVEVTRVMPHCLVGNA